MSYESEWWVMTISKAAREPSQLIGFDSAAASRCVPLNWPRVQLAGAVADLLDHDDAMGMIMSHAEQRGGDVLGVVSVNLDHLHHFGSGRASARLERKSVLNLSIDGNARWMA